MKIIETKSAKKQAEDLPAGIISKYSTQKERLAKDARDPRLHTKKLVGMEDDIYSFRITRAFRALFYFHTSETIVIFAIGHRKNIYR